eukprot:TRINITY_DN6804_c0_g1_i1.p1 TRINITY_DN6804_c0_g1~~TRINITY_DN6804_c0_g1_i1.p1  ORF type:complete len:378 (-),score=83.99 TRINITY_DN6804_c0_g1_i1:1374-2507(-)
MGFVFHKRSSDEKFTSKDIEAAVDVLVAPFSIAQSLTTQRPMTHQLLVYNLVLLPKTRADEEQKWEALLIIPVHKPSGLWQLKVQMMKTKPPARCDPVDLFDSISKCFPRTELLKTNEQDDDDDDSDKDDSKHRQEEIQTKSKDKEQDLPLDALVADEVESRVLSSWSEVSQLFNLGWDAGNNDNVLRCFPESQFVYVTHLLRFGSLASDKSVMTSICICSQLTCEPDSGVLSMHVPPVGFSKDNYVWNKPTPDSDEEDCYDAPEAWFKHRVYSMDAEREAAGKTGAEMLKDMKLRHASGTRTKIIPPEEDTSVVFKLVQRLVAFNSTQPDSMAQFLDESKAADSSFVKTMPFKTLRMRSMAGPHPNVTAYLPLITR